MWQTWPSQPAGQPITADILLQIKTPYGSLFYQAHWQTDSWILILNIVLSIIPFFGRSFVFQDELFAWIIQNQAVSRKHTNVSFMNNDYPPPIITAVRQLSSLLPIIGLTGLVISTVSSVTPINVNTLPAWPVMWLLNNLQIIFI